MGYLLFRQPRPALILLPFQPPICLFILRVTRPPVQLALPRSQRARRPTTQVWLRPITRVITIPLHRHSPRWTPRLLITRHPPVCNRCCKVLIFCLEIYDLKIEILLFFNFTFISKIPFFKSEIFVFVRPKSSVQVFILNFRNELMYFIFNGALCLPTYSSSLLKNFVSDIISHCTFLSILSKTTVFRNIKNNKILKIFKFDFFFLQKAKLYFRNKGQPAFESKISFQNHVILYFEF